MRNSQQTLACFVNLNQSFNNLYELKFKGKKILEDILNAFWQRESMEKQVKASFSVRDNIVFRSAIDNCTAYITATFTHFQQEFIKKYNENTEVMQRNADYFRSRREQLGGIQGQYDMLLHQLVQLALKISSQYLNQRTLILKFSQQAFLKYMESNKQGEELKELMLHIGFQTQLDSLSQQMWKKKIFALSNQRYNSNK